MSNHNTNDFQQVTLERVEIYERPLYKTLWKRAVEVLNWTTPNCRYSSAVSFRFSTSLNLLFGLASTLTAANLYYSYPILNKIADDFGVSYEKAALIPTLAQAGYGSGILLLCPLGDRVRVRPFVLSLVALTAVVWICLCITSNLQLFCAITFITSFTTVTPQLMLPLVGSLAPPARRATAFSIVFAGLMSLSRPILRGLNSVGFNEPTPIQAKTIPLALEGKDLVGGAVTGSGKTAAFVVPILERLLYRPNKIPTSRVVILTPTRELAIQCHAVATKLASHTDIKFCLAVGGLSLKVQEAELRLRPDVIIATPGRFIDHMRNSASFSTDTIEILVLDEADRMLEDGFADELNEILTTLPKSRQTMLFSATMRDVPYVESMLA